MAVVRIPADGGEDRWHQRVEAFIKESCEWLRKYEPPVTADEDLTGHELRTNLCELRNVNLDADEDPARIHGLLVECMALVAQITVLRWRRSRQPPSEGGASREQL